MIFIAELIVIGTICYAVVEIFWYWYIQVRHIPLSRLSEISHILDNESVEQKNKILKQGWITQKEYHKMLHNQLDEINKELKRRGMKQINNDNARLRA